MSFSARKWAGSGGTEELRVRSLDGVPGSVLGMCQMSCVTVPYVSTLKEGTRLRQGSAPSGVAGRLPFLYSS